MSTRSTNFAKLLLCCGLLELNPGPALVQAEEPAPNARALGITESMLKYCARVDASAVVRLKEQARLLVQGASAQTVARVRNTDDYRKAYDSVTDFVGKVAEQNAKRPCEASIAGRK
jgi:hypothetical protein